MTTTPIRAMPQVGDLVAAKYRIEGVIGEGGMGTVYAATHTLTGKRMALKWMLPALAAEPGAVQRFMREAQAAGGIDHPNIVNVHDVGEHEGAYFMVMEYLHGETLSAALARGGLTPQQVIELLLPAMRGVAAAHLVGVVHRDLKPDNIFLCRAPDGSYRESKVLDFGISKVASAEGALNPRLTRTGAVMGTPYYMSPEQVRSGDIDHRVDIYAFGVILYEALTGRVPFDADAYSALVLAIATGTPKRPSELRPELPAALEAVVMRAMAREVDARYQNMQSLVEALQPFAHGLNFKVDPTSARRLSSGTTPFVSDLPVAIPVKRGSLGIALVSLAFVVVGIGVWIGMKPAAEQANVVQPAPVAAAAGPSPVAASPDVAADVQPVAVTQDAGVVVAAPAAKTPPVVAPAQGLPAGAAVPAVHDRGAAAPLPTRRSREREATDRTRQPAPRTGRTGGITSEEF